MNLNTENIYEIANELIRKAVLRDEGVHGPLSIYWPVSHDEYDKFELEMEGVEKHLKNNLPNDYKIEKLELKDYNDVSLSVYAGGLTIQVSNTLNGNSFNNCTLADPLTPAEIYEQNKTSTKCVGCSQPTEIKAILSSKVNYCQSCSG